MKSHAEREERTAIEDLLQRFLIVIEIKGREEAEGAKVKAHDRRRASLEERVGVHEKSVPSKGNDQIERVHTLRRYPLDIERQGHIGLLEVGKYFILYEDVYTSSGE